MKKIILVCSIAISLLSTLFAQNKGVVWASYHDRAYMDTLNGSKVLLPNDFIKGIDTFGIVSYQQSFPYSKNSKNCNYR